jgi:hypothetical protein
MFSSEIAGVIGIGLIFVVFAGVICIFLAASYGGYWSGTPWIVLALLVLVGVFLVHGKEPAPVSPDSISSGPSDTVTKTTNDNLPKDKQEARDAAPTLMRMNINGTWRYCMPPSSADGQYSCDMTTAAPALK